jgi:hypothetical protein
MRILTILFFLSTSFFSFSQINCEQTDSLILGPESTPYAQLNRTRGFWFKALSGFEIVGFKAGDGDPQGPGAFAQHQSVEIIEFTALNNTDTMPYDYTDLLAGVTNPHTLLFQAQNMPYGWGSCSVIIEKNKYYAVVGAKNEISSGEMFNSYTTSDSAISLAGKMTRIHWCGVQSSLSTTSPPSGSYFHEPPVERGRIHLLIKTDDSPKAYITADNLDLEGGAFAGTAPYSYNWSTGETTSTIDPTGNGIFWLLVTDAQGCVSDTAFYNYSLSSINQIDFSNKEVHKIINMLGKESNNSSKGPLFYIYKDGTIEKKIILK